MKHLLKKYKYNKMKVFYNLTFLLIFVVSTLTVSAQVPRTISYQGVLTDPQGNLIADGNRTITLRLYESLASTTPLYTEIHNAVVVKGIFNAIIGSQSPLPTDLSFDRAYFLGVTIDVGSELLPRTPLTAVPYALMAHRATIADGLSNNATGIVTSVNNQEGDLLIEAGSGANITSNNGTITISATGTGGTGIQGVQNQDGTITIANPTGPNATISLADNAVKSNHIQNGTILLEDIASGVIPHPSNFIINGAPAGGDLTGTFPNPLIGSGKVTSGHILDGTIQATDIANGVIPNTSNFIQNGSNAGGDLTATYPNPTIGTGKVSTTHILDGTIQATDIANGVIPSTANFIQNGSNAGGDLTGTYPNPFIGFDRVTTLHIQDGTISREDHSTIGVPLNSVLKLVGTQFGATWEYVPAKIINAGAGINIVGNSFNDDITISATNSGGTVISTGTNDPNFLTKWTAPNTITKSTIYELDGNVGIGVAPATAKLDVNGNAKFKSTVANTPALLATHTGSGLTQGTAIQGVSENIGVHGRVTTAQLSTPTGIGVRGDTDAGSGVSGFAGLGDGVIGTSQRGSGVVGITSSFDQSQAAVRALNNSEDGYGVHSTADGINSVSVFGFNKRGKAIYGSVTTGEAIYGDNEDSNTTGFAGYFRGRVQMTKDLTVLGNVIKGSSTFKIDHPLDPANKYLSHSVVESPDMMNMYNGTIVLDGSGEAVVKLPSYFDALNTDFRYSLTPIGAFAPVYIKEEVKNNAFKIAGGTPGLKISWQVTGIRKDKFAEKYRIIAEQEKSAEEKGKYMHPEVFGKSIEQGVHYKSSPSHD